MGIALQVNGIGRIVYQFLDNICRHMSAGKHFNRNEHGLLNNELMGGNVKGESLYLGMGREWNYVCTLGYYAPITLKCGTSYGTYNAIPAKYLNNILVG